MTDPTPNDDLTQVLPAVRPRSSALAISDRIRHATNEVMHGRASASTIATAVAERPPLAALEARNISAWLATTRCSTGSRSRCRPA